MDYRCLTFQGKSKSPKPPKSPEPESDPEPDPEPVQKMKPGPRKRVGSVRADHDSSFHSNINLTHLCFKSSCQTTHLKNINRH